MEPLTATAWTAETPDGALAEDEGPGPPMPPLITVSISSSALTGIPFYIPAEENGYEHNKREQA